MKLEFLSKSVDYVGGEPYKTRVVLGNSEGAIYPVFFDPDFISKESGELFKLALDKIFFVNFPDKAETDKFNQIDEQLEKNKKAGEANKQKVEDVATLTDVLISLAITRDGGMEQSAYAKVAAIIKPLIKDKRYFNNDIVSMPYPFDTNPKWTQGTATIFKFQMQQSEGYTYQNQTVAEMLQEGVLTIVMPKIE
ncbi:DUF1366 domain-containing protein [Streptococcus anginosus]|uniref:DUF1366 domain-containing protein n=1 Tax=Streptococcus anginosus TaxID=1328 RepID=UPI0021F8167F|nr:DUF1366 domain-containing protein [Streptococcus anginosus]MCW1021055.1 DUF1366 domain-containing protein [Streptococcus anginosus]MCW1036977.1 DUF1366 domain-containing protein [Streptococcus anginosus]MED5793575.1 DUF1366 domain-containing protein [Streptococcus anginosus]MED5795539.1 DUF1366 domain-containing protein [Streptococcus anginosus]MED5885411.1 DUF1366 domain-containing protein [Streptococcus anginosus]